MRRTVAVRLRRDADRRRAAKCGFAKHLRDALPNATYIGFTGTPIETNDKSTRAVFGNYIDVYDLTQAVEDGATVKIYYESRLAKVELTRRTRGAGRARRRDHRERRGTEADEAQDSLGARGSHRRRRATGST